MIRYVLDASVAIKWVLREDLSEKAIRLRDDYADGRSILIAPDIFPAEVGHALLFAERGGRIANSQALLADVVSTCPILYTTRPLLPDVATLVAVARISLYDALYVALAEREGCELVTADEKLKRNLPHSPIRMLSMF